MTYLPVHLKRLTYFLAIKEKQDAAVRYLGNLSKKYLIYLQKLRTK